MLTSHANAESSPASTVAMVTDTCPQSESGLAGWAQKESVIWPALTSTLLPNAIGATWDALASAIHQKATEKDRTVAAKAGVSFYRANAAGDLFPGAQIGCLFVSNGPIDSSSPDSMSVMQGALATVKDTGQSLLDAAGITTRPHVYLETSFEFSPDHTAFRLVPERLFYARTIDARKSSASNGLAVVVTFRRPSSATAGEAFAVGTMSFPFARPGHEYFASHLGPNTRRLASNWMPLPTPDPSIASKLAALVENGTTAQSNAERTTSLLRDVASDGKSFAQRLASVTGNEQVTDFSCVFADSKVWTSEAELPKGFRTWKADLGQSIEALTRQRALADEAARNASGSPKTALSKIAGDHATELEILKACSLAAQARHRVYQDWKAVKENTAVDVEVSVTESLQPSKFLVWADAVMSGSKEAATKQTVEHLDPVKRKADANAANATRQTAENAALQAWVDARKDEIDLAEMPLGSAQQRKAQLDLDLKKRDVNRQYLQLGWVAPFPETQS